jgi:hypothetical protein
MKKRYIQVDVTGLNDAEVVSLRHRPVLLFQEFCARKKVVKDQETMIDSLQHDNRLKQQKIDELERKIRQDENAIAVLARMLSEHMVII